MAIRSDPVGSTILAQLALMFLLAFPAGLAVRPVAKASVAFCAALALVLCAAVAFPCVGSSTFGAFAVPIVFGLPVMLAVHGRAWVVIFGREAK